ncbi:MAG: penicillin-binding protein 2, partial [Leptolyngbyaceae cyanobacterium RM2_2_4]|nr:penicillin-binding protein 2 [Leptolyngbyaceae cyanobacterium RM2_2_4]
MASGISYASDRRSAKTSLLRSSSRDKLAWRGVFLMLFMTAIMSAFVVRLTQLQLVQGEYNQRLAEQNRVRLIPIPSDRGNITDRDGKLFAANRLARSVYLW